MHKQFCLLLLLLFLPAVRISGQQVALKTNMLFLATTSLNASVEVAIGKRFSVDIWGAYNPWKFRDEMRLNFYLAQPEVRYWFCRKFEGHFIGLHGHYGRFSIGQIPFIPNLKQHEVRGNLYGGGLSYGYHWAIGRRWGLEATVGFGYAQMKYTRYKCGECAEPAGSYTRSYIGPTRAGFSIIYFLR